VTVVNSGPVAVYLGGGSGVSAQAVAVAPGGQVTLLGAPPALWAVTASGTSSVIAGPVTDVVATFTDATMLSCAVGTSVVLIFDVTQYPAGGNPSGLVNPDGSAPPAVYNPVPGWVFYNPAGGAPQNAGVLNYGASTVYVGGGTTASAASGLPVAPGSLLLLPGAAPAVLYGICSAAAGTSIRTGLVTISLAA
jgi:hypothetical protein